MTKTMTKEDKDTISKGLNRVWTTLDRLEYIAGESDDKVSREIQAIKQSIANLSAKVKYNTEAETPV